MNCCSTNGSCFWVLTNNWSILSNVVRDIVPAFDTKEVEASFFLFLPGFGNLRISTTSGSIFWNLESISEIIENDFRTWGSASVKCYERRIMTLLQVIYKSARPYPWHPLSVSLSLFAIVAVGRGWGSKEFFGCIIKKFILVVWHDI